MPNTPKISTALSDRYVIKHELGAGGMAIVYLAHDQKLDREVALKVLRPELGAVLGAERFLTEIKISARLDHPHILTLIDSGDADGTLYYVLPYVRGESLRNKLVRERQLPLGEAIAITRQVASALDYAHRQGLVHRDIKPENIMIQEGEAMLTDFGIALAVTEAGGNRLTQTGLSLGTPQYMSPEQATGDRGIDGRSDVYSLASVLYEMLAGEPPVTGSTAQAMIAKLMTETPTRVRVLRDTVPESIDAALAKALAKTPADRFATADEFARALDLTASQANASVPRPAGRRMAVWGIAAALVLAVAAFALRGMGHSARASLGRKTQLTVFGGVLTPAIAPDGKQLAYTTRHCGAGGCTFDVVEQDVGGTTTRTILQAATAAYGLEWSPDRRNLIFSGTVNHRFGSFLLSALGGPPRFLTSGSATFYSGGDSLLLGPTTHPDSVNWIRVTGLDGGVRDSIRVAGVGQGLAAISAVPGTQWIVTLVLQEPHGLWQVIDRSGKVADHVVNACTCGGIATRDAVWLDRIAGAAGEAVVRIGLDRNNGHLASRQDTMIIGRFTGVSLTADGSQMVMDEGTIEFSVWAVNFADVLQGRLPNERRIAQSSNRLGADVSPDGARLLFGRAVPTGAGHTEVQFGVAPFSGSPETPITAPGHVLSAWWSDSVTLGVRSRTAQGIELAEQDVRTGARTNILDLPDSSLRSVAALPGGGWAWVPITGDRIMVRQGNQTRELREPAWYGFIGDLIADPAGGRVFIVGFNAATGDSLGVSALTLSDGSSTQWVTMPSESGDIGMLPGGAVFLIAYPSAESLAFFKLTGPGQMQRLGNPPRPLFEVSVSDDLKRATAMARDYRADAWMYDVVRY